jgi:predicted membrane protein
MAQADFSAPSVVLDCRVAFGGVELIVPSNWEVKNEISSSFGSVEDERSIQANISNETRKILILRGSCSFGSVEIKSY